MVAGSTADEASERMTRYVATGDVAIIDALLAEHLDRAYCQARRLLGQASEAEDAVQNAFVRVLRNASRYDGSIPFAAWLGKLVHNAAIDAARSRKRRRFYEQRAQTAPADPSRGGDEPEPEAEQIRAAVLKLPERYRVSVDLHYFAGLSQLDVARTLGISENAVAKSLQRARDCLRELLQRRGVRTTGAVVLLALTTAPAFSAPATLVIAPVSIAKASAGLAGLKFAAVALVASAFVGIVARSAIGRRGVDVAWSFDQAVSSDSQLSLGTWQAHATGGVDDSGCLAGNHLQRLTIRIPHSALPVVVTYDALSVPPEPANGFTSTVAWNHIDEGSQFFNLAKPVTVDLDQGPRWLRFRRYVTEHYICSDGQAADFEYVVFLEPTADAEVQIACRGAHRLDNLSVRSIDPKEVPDVSVYARILDRFDSSQRHGEIEVRLEGRAAPVRLNFFGKDFASTE